jgi:hypothetical protein
LQISFGQKGTPAMSAPFLVMFPPALQVEFAVVHHIPVPDLAAFAAAFSAWSGETYTLAA